MHAVLIWDGAGFHTGEDVVVPSNVSLIQLPPYSPELNPVENLWHYLRAHHWSNRRYRDYDALQEEAVRSLCAVREDIETIKTVCNSHISQGAHEIAGKRIRPPRQTCHRKGSGANVTTGMIDTTGSKWGTREKSRASAKGASVGRVYHEVSFNNLGSPPIIEICTQEPIS